ncbi:hypothetical protein TYRP_000009, partial [Tyrophagus putrescentiae]
MSLRAVETNPPAENQPLSKLIYRKYKFFIEIEMIEECQNEDQNEVFEEEMPTASDTDNLYSSND